MSSQTGESHPAQYRYRFGTAEFDESRFDLCVSDLPVEVQRKPLEILGLLLLRLAAGGFLLPHGLGKLFGWFTATESGCIAVLYGAVLALLVYREMDLAGLKEALLDTGRDAAQARMAAVADQTWERRVQSVLATLLQHFEPQRQPAS